MPITARLSLRKCRLRLLELVLQPLGRKGIPEVQWSLYCWRKVPSLPPTSGLDSASVQRAFVVISKH